MSTDSIWQKEVSVELLNRMNRDTVNERLGIEFTAVDGRSLRAKVEVSSKTRQPFGLLHGGVSVVLAESLGSAGAYHASAPGCIGVGLEVNANHLRAVKQGFVYGVATPVHLGRTTQVWEIRITDEQDRLCCISRITVAVVQQAGA